MTKKFKEVLFFSKLVGLKASLYQAAIHMLGLPLTVFKRRLLS
jgi:hypothetical protein